MRASRRRPLSVQTLEPREVPAGVVAVSFANGALALTGDDLNNVLWYAVGTDAGGAPVVRLTPDASTAIDDPTDPNPPVPGATVTIPGVPAALRTVLKGGDDAFRLDNASPLILADGADFDLGDGGNTLELITNQVIKVGGLTVNAGDGPDDVTVLPPEASGSGITPGRRFDQPVKFALGNGGYYADVESFAIPGRGGLQLTAGDGPGYFYTYGLTAAGPATGRVGNGDHLWHWTAATIGSLSVLGTGPGAGWAVELLDGTVAGNVRVTGATLVDLSATSTAIGGSVTVQKNSYPAAYGSARVGAVANLTLSTVAGSVTVSAGGGSSEAALTVDRAGVTGPVAVVNTGANASAYLEAAEARLDGAVRVIASGPGEADARATWRGASRARSLTVRGTDDASLDVTDRLTVGDPADPAVRGDVIVAATYQFADLDVDGGELLARHLTVTASDDATAELEDAAALRLTGNLSISSREIARIRDVRLDGTVEVAGAVSVRGTDGASVEVGGSWSSGNLSVVSPGGDGAVLLDGTPVTALGAVTLQAGHQARFVRRAEFVEPMLSLRVTGGSGDDVVQTYRVTIQGVANLNLGNGNNTVDLDWTSVVPHPSDPRGNLTVSTGTGNDRVELTGLAVAGATAVTTGAGADALVADASSFTGKVTADLGAGDDQLRIAQDVAPDSPVMFASVVSVRAGLGNDTLELGLLFSPVFQNTNTKAVFQAAGNTIDGGSGADTFDPAVQWAELEGAATLNVTGWDGVPAP